MKTTIFLIILMLILIPSIISQEQINKTNFPVNEKCKNLITCLNVSLLFGKHEGMSPAEYGSYVANQFIKQGWANEGNFEEFTNTCIYNLTCFGAGDVKTVSKYGDSVIIKSDVIYDIVCEDYPLRNISAKEYYEYFTAAFNRLGQQLGFKYNTIKEGDLVYTTISKE